ncbi:MAG: hypothetical protein KF729_04390 [Sandaracinaceae bacterium]|nr:hypothetical protein [Sandaracinaceae bacterium]
MTDPEDDRDDVLDDEPRDELRVIAGMIASETTEHRAERLIALLERGALDEARAIATARAAATAAAFAKELASLD